VGGLYVPEAKLSILESGLNELCSEYKFPDNEVFKWSPDRDTWMHNNLVLKSREDFYNGALSLAKVNEATALVIIEDMNAAMATDAKSRDIDLINLLLERFQRELEKRNNFGLVLTAQPSGDRKDENKFLSQCFNTLKCGTDYVKTTRIILNVLSSPYKFIRILQLADVIVSCTTAFVVGEDRFSPTIFQTIKPLFARDSDRIGGVGLKIHPDIKYHNLYYWLLGDTHFWKRNLGYPMPRKEGQYSVSPNDP